MPSEKDVMKLGKAMFDMFADMEDIMTEQQSLSDADKEYAPLFTMIDAIAKKLDISDADEDANLLDVIVERIGEAYGTYLKLIGAASRAAEASKTMQPLHQMLETLSSPFKELIVKANEYKNP